MRILFNYTKNTTLKFLTSKVIFLIIILIICLWGIIFTLPKLFPPPPLLQHISFSQAVYDQHQHLLRLTLSKDDKYRLYTPLQDISPIIIEATLLQEDSYFYWHPGINPFALVKAGWQTYVKQSRQMGASTLSMQLARIYFNINSKTVSGKLWQMLRALQLELFYSKKQILEAYLNLAPYGGNIEGVGAASLIYFAKPANQVILPEALLLSVIPQNPNSRTPTLATDNTQLQNARLRLFNRWIKKYPNASDQKIFMSLPLQFAHRKLPFLAGHFVDNVLKKDADQPIIITTLDYNLQKMMEQVAQNYLMHYRSYGVNNLAVLLVDTRNMEVKALLGSGNFFSAAINGQVNGTTAKRSPGSSLKPFIYALALDQGLIHPATMLKDAPDQFGAYDPENFDYDFMGPVTAKDALTLSRNIPAIYLMSQLKTPNFYQFLKAALVSGLQAEKDYGLSLALGGAEVTMQELVTLYAALANGGKWRPLRMQLSEPIAAGEQLLSPEAAFLTLDMLKDTPRPGLVNSAMVEQLPVYWKTGTSSGYRDAWSVGVFGPYVLAVWIGDFQGKSNPAYVGAKSAAPLFFSIIASLSKRGPLPSILANPQELQLTRVAVCEGSGLLPTRYCPNLKETWFIPGKSPIKTDIVYREIAINKKTGLRACRFDNDTQWQVYEFWPSDLLKIFSQAGIQRRVPPPYAADCTLDEFTNGTPPKIISPKPELIYSLSAANNNHRDILFSASADADVKKLYWFINNSFAGSASRDESLPWLAKPGQYTVRVIDDHGRSDARELWVENVGNAH